jgi:hypothetical protein
MMQNNRPNDRMQEVMQNLGKEPRPFMVTIPVTKIWRWFKNRKKNRHSCEGRNPEKPLDSGSSPE